MSISILVKLYGAKVPFDKDEEKRLIGHFTFHIKHLKTPYLEECREFVVLEEMFCTGLNKRSAKSVQDKVRSVITKSKAQMKYKQQFK